jgi:hypothetical protein
MVRCAADCLKGEELFVQTVNTFKKNKARKSDIFWLISSLSVGN